MRVLKVVRHIDGRLVMRPGKNHPNPVHWESLREVKREQQGNACGTCWRSGGEYGLELHHRHYDTWGEERSEDVVFLCSSCHESITNVIRARRLALGDQTFDFENTGRTEHKTMRPACREYSVPDVLPAPESISLTRPQLRQNKEILA